MERTIPNRKEDRGAPADARVRRSRDGLRAALLDLLTERAFDDISVREITERAQVGYTTFFRHFLGKEALLDYLITIEVERLTERALPIYDSADGLGACLALCTYIDEHRPLWSALITGGAASQVRETMLDQSRKLTIARASHDGLPADLSTALAVAVMIELLSWWLRQTTPWPADTIAAILYERIIVPSARP